MAVSLAVTEDQHGPVHDGAVQSFRSLEMQGEQRVWKRKNAQFSAWLGGLSIALQGGAAGLCRNESTPLTHADIFEAQHAASENLERKRRELATLNLETFQVCLLDETVLT